MSLVKGFLRKTPAGTDVVKPAPAVQTSGWLWKKQKPVPKVPSWLRLSDAKDGSAVATLANAQSIDVHPHLITDCSKVHAHPEHRVALKAPEVKTLRLWMNRFYNHDGVTERVYLHNHEPHTHFLHSQCHLLAALRPKTLVLRNVTIARTKLISLAVPRDVLKYVKHLVLVVLPNREDAHSTCADDRHCALSHLSADLAKIKNITIVFQTVDRYRAWRPYPEGFFDKDDKKDKFSESWETETLVGHESKKAKNRAEVESYGLQRKGREFRKPSNVPQDMVPWLDHMQRLWVAHIFDWAAQIIRTHHTLHLTLVHASSLRPPQSSVTKSMTPHKFLQTIPWMIRGFGPKNQYDEPFPDRLQLMSMTTFLQKHGAEVYAGSNAMSNWPANASLDAAEDATLQRLMMQSKEPSPKSPKSFKFPQSPKSPTIPGK